MSKPDFQFKTPLVILLAVAIIVAVAFLPTVVGMLQENFRANQVRFAPLSEVQLQFDENNRTLRESFAILAKADHRIEIPPLMATLTKSEVQQIAEQTVKAYQDAGLILHEIDVSYNTRQCNPFLFYFENEETESGIFWSVQLADSIGEWDFLMIIDDRTGAVLSVSYGWYAEVQEALTEESFSKFCDLTLTELGMEYSEFDAMTVAKNAKKTADSDISGSISWEDPTYGKCVYGWQILESTFYTFYA